MKRILLSLIFILCAALLLCACNVSGGVIDLDSESETFGELCAQSSETAQKLTEKITDRIVSKPTEKPNEELSEEELLEQQLQALIAESIPKLSFTLTDDGTYSVKAINENIDGTIVLPDTYEGIPVTAIEDYAFRECNNINAIIVSESVTSLGNGAFMEMQMLQTVVLSEGPPIYFVWQYRPLTLFAMTHASW